MEHPWPPGWALGAQRVVGKHCSGYWCSAFLIGGDEVDGCRLLVGGGVEGAACKREDGLLVYGPRCLPGFPEVAPVQLSPLELVTVRV
jgi:hypothetical protein